MFSTAPPRSDLNTEDKSTQMLLGVHCSENNINSHKRGNALSAESDVVLVVAKAKRAAQSLWMILHAQVRYRIWQYEISLQINKLCQYQRYIRCID